MWKLTVLIFLLLLLLKTLICDLCPLYRTKVATRIQCDNLCRYVKPCVSYSFDSSSHLCSVWSDEGSGTAVTEYKKDKKHMCSTLSCRSTELCVPVSAGTNALCLTYDDDFECEISDYISPESLENVTVYDNRTVMYQSTGAKIGHGVSVFLENVNNTLSGNVTICGLPNYTSPGVFGKFNVKMHDNTVMYECMAGYTKIGDGVSVCLENATWSIPFIKCTLPDNVTNCGLPNYTSPGVLGNVAMHDSNTVMYECMGGYTKIGDGVSVCLENATWSIPVISCKLSGNVTNCGLPNYTFPGVLGNVVMHDNNTVMYECMDGYTKIGDGVSVCLENATWSIPVISCTLSGNVTNCGLPNYTSPGVLGNVAMHDSNTVMYECMDGYTKIGDGVSVCLENAAWSIPNISCHLKGNDQRCGNPDYTSVGVSGNVTLHTNAAVYDCQVGYVKVGDGVSVCQNNGTWSHPNITCLGNVTNCGLPNYTFPGVLGNVVMHDNNTVMYECMDEYTKIGDGVSVCLENAAWSIPNISCHLKGNDQRCGNPDYTSVGVSGNVTLHTNAAVYDCQVGYVKVGDGVSVCQNNGTWSHPNITCLEIVCELPVWIIANTTSTEVTSNQHGASISYSCNKGHHFTGGNATSFCQQDGSWSKPSIQCPVIQCLQPVGTIENTTYSMTSSNYGDIVTYSCVVGFKYIDGNDTSVCQVDGTWSQSNIRCNEIVCARPMWIIPNTTSTEVTSKLYGASITYSCNKGHNFEGGSATSFCQQDGSWSKPSIKCPVTQCLQPIQTIENATHSMTSSNYGDIVTYSCVKGYKNYGGNDTSVCQEDGTWSTPTIHCGMWEEWAIEVLGFSSQFKEKGWFAEQILGKNNIYPAYGDKQGTWAASKKNCPTGKEWIKVRFNESLYLHRVDIYETMNAGMVKKLSGGSVNGTWTTIWQAESVKPIGESRIFSPKFTPLPYSIDRVMMETDCRNAFSWVEFDAIKIVGLKTPPPSAF